MKKAIGKAEEGRPEDKMQTDVPTTQTQSVPETKKSKKKKA